MERTPLFDSRFTLPVLDSPTAAPPGQRQLHDLRRQLLAMNEAQAVLWFELVDYDRLLKTTVSLCPSCLQHVAAIVYSRQGRVWIRKRCAEHGLSDAVLENDERFYFLSNKDCWGRRFAEDRMMKFPAFAGGCCGDSGRGTSGCDSVQSNGVGSYGITDQMDNKTCTVLVEITNACNLSCKVCYSDSKGDRILPAELFERHIQQLIVQKGGLDSVQLTGGEAMLHPQFWDMLAFLHRQDVVKKIYLPTNGILLARREIAERLGPFRDKLMVLLQFDGRTAEANQNLRNADPAAVRQRVIENLGALGIVMQLTMTISKGVNDSEIGWVIDTAMRHSHIKLVALQPVTYSGRYELERAATERLTLSDVVKSVGAQAKIRVNNDDFVPIPCSHPNCGWLTLFVRRFGLKWNVARHIDLAAVMNQVAYKTILSKQEIRDMVGTTQPAWWSRLVGAIGRRVVRPTDLFGIAIKPFMDSFNYDQDRISNCCHHLMDTNGTPVSFCEYNAVLRSGDSWSKFPLLQKLDL
jgi:uncharacterized radical SAM superfamily Fe-S cluster-containing enzyme